MYSCKFNIIFIQGYEFEIIKLFKISSMFPCFDKIINVLCVHVPNTAVKLFILKIIYSNECG